MEKGEFFEREISAYERSILRLRSSGEYGDIVRQEFLDEDLDAAAERFASSAVAAEILAMVRETGAVQGARILDLGGGRGLLSRFLQGSGYRVTLLEVSRSPVCGLGALAGRNFPFCAVCGNGEAMPFGPAAFDLVICKQVLHHTRDLRCLLSEVQRVLRPGGSAIAYREHCLPWYGGKKAFLASHPSARHGAQENAFRTITYCRAFRRSGFREVRLWDIRSPEQLWAEYTADPRKRRWLSFPIVGRGLFALACWKYSVWRYWCGAPGQVMSFIARK